MNDMCKIRRKIKAMSDEMNRIAEEVWKEYEKLHPNPPQYCEVLRSGAMTSEEAKEIEWETNRRLELEVFKRFMCSDALKTLDSIHTRRAR